MRQRIKQVTRQKNRQGIKREIARQSMCLFLTAVLLLTAGCGTGSEAGSKKQTQELTIGNEKAMGRYAEQTFDLSDTLPVALGIYEKESGLLEAYDYINGRFQSKDGGESWENIGPGMPEELTTDYYVKTMNASPEGELALTAISSSEEEATAYRYLLISPDGSQTDLDFPIGEDQTIDSFWFAADGILYAVSSEGEIFQVEKESGAGQLYEQVTGKITFIEATEDYLIALSEDKATIFQKDTKEEIQDTALNQFMAQKPGVSQDIRYGMGGTDPIYLLPDQENTLYFICAAGVFRHTIGGELMEQLVNGALSSLSDPSAGIAGAVLEETGSFLVLYSGGSLVRFTYDPELAAVPEIQLRIYSLYENDIVNQGVSLFRSKHPEIYVKYEIGLDQTGAATREDALKKLNTEIAGGEGPDLFVLDDMPVDSYISKGILKDLSAFQSSLPEEEKQLENMAVPWMREGAVYGLTAQFTLPLALGQKEDLSQITDLVSLADWAEKKREEEKAGMLLGCFTPEDLLNKLIPFCQPAWKEEGGALNEELLNQFFRESKRIWDAETVGITDSALAGYKERVEQYLGSGISEEEAIKLASSVSDQALDYAVSRQFLMSGVISDSMDFSIGTSGLRMRQGQGSTFHSKIGQADNIFCPSTIIGISSAASDAAMAESLLGTIMSEENLSLIFGIFPNHKKALQQAYGGSAITDAGPGGVYGSFGIEQEDGTSVAMDIYWPEKELFDRFDQLIKEAETAYIRDSVLEETVTDEGIKVLAGEQSPEDAAAAVQQKLSIYFAE